MKIQKNKVLLNRDWYEKDRRVQREGRLCLEIPTLNLAIDQWVWIKWVLSKEKSEK